MSVYIKGFPLPNNCGACPLRLAWCRERIYMVTRPERCPLVPVPPHGRLIDSDALKLTHCKECTLYPDKCLEKTAVGCDWGSIYHIEHCAPTIIPADSAEEGEA